MAGFFISQEVQMENPNPLKALLYSRKFWLAVVALVQTVLFQFVPGFPEEVWQAIDAVLIVVIATIAWEDVAQKRGQ
jgi:type III secretory pathway component EscV